MDWLLITRFGVLNVVAIVGFVLMTMAGWVTQVIEKDTSYISIGIFVLFLFGMTVTTNTVFLISKELNGAGKATGFASKDVQNMQKRLAARLATIAETASFLVMLGLIGTVLGFIEAMAGISTDTVMDSNATLKMVVELVNGMNVALYTTLVGSVLYLWLRSNYRLAANGATKLTALMERKVSSERQV